ncbi:hypothetical protein UA08_02673 [Talaromyces atroroseus]|uniref:Uncharacterized protein n=1 Tax=Talaromyces atroroseus TaxID=1441469 RepID=A0A225B358_TALAT|nr:hypothetical protein UA08_02673 [Talaromyces atroroseus]OKL62439.1 hypothetical protein UA08_02673 [Talaromyces atroroseus]
MFWFDPEVVWGLNGTGADALFSNGLKKAFNSYHTASKWMCIAYIIALLSTGVELLVGISAIFSRLGSFATSCVAGVSTFFTIAAAITSTTLFATLDITLDSATKEYQIRSTLGTRMLAVTWIAVAFRLPVASSGGLARAASPVNRPAVPTPYLGAGGTHPEGTAYQAPLLSRQAGPQITSSTYEPFRHTGLEDGA